MHRAAPPLRGTRQREPARPAGLPAITTEPNNPNERRGFLAAAVGSTIGTIVVFLIVAFLVHLSGEPTFSQTMDFGHNHDLELSELFIVYNIALAFIVGAPWGAWVALKRRRYPPPRWPTVIAILILAPIIGMFAVGKVPSSSGDPVYEPIVIVATAFVTGFLGRLLTAFKPSHDVAPDDRP